MCRLASLLSNVSIYLRVSMILGISYGIFIYTLNLLCCVFNSIRHIAIEILFDIVVLPSLLFAFRLHGFLNCRTLVVYIDPTAWPGATAPVIAWCSFAQKAPRLINLFWLVLQSTGFGVCIAIIEDLGNCVGMGKKSHQAKQSRRSSSPDRASRPPTTPESRGRSRTPKQKARGSRDDGVVSPKPKKKEVVSPTVLAEFDMPSMFHSSESSDSGRSSASGSPSACSDTKQKAIKQDSMLKYVGCPPDNNF